MVLVGLHVKPPYEILGEVMGWIVSFPDKLLNFTLPFDTAKTIALLFEVID